MTHKLENNYIKDVLSSVDFSCSVMSVSLCPMDCSMAGLPVHHHNPEFTQTHAHWVSDTIQPLPPLSFPSPPIFSFPASGSFPMSQFFPSGGQSIGVSASTSALPMNIQDLFPLGWTGWICYPRDSQESSTPQFKHQFFSAQLSL